MLLKGKASAGTMEKLTTSVHRQQQQQQQQETTTDNGQHDVTRTHQHQPSASKYTVVY